MALRQTIQTEFGEERSLYWFASKVCFEFEAGLPKQALITLSGYISKEAMEAGAKPLDERAFTIPTDRFLFLVGLMQAEFAAIAYTVYMEAKEQVSGNAPGEKPFLNAAWED